MSRIEEFEREALDHFSDAYNLARWLAQNEQDAEDLVQESYLRALKYFGTFNGGNFRVWLMAIVRNTYYSWRSGRQLAVGAESFDDEQHSNQIDSDLPALNQHFQNPEHWTAQLDRRNLCVQALELLSLEFREVVVLRELEGFSYKEIAELTGAPVGTVMSRLARARRKLSLSLADSLGGARPSDPIRPQTGRAGQG